MGKQVKAKKIKIKEGDILSGGVELPDGFKIVKDKKKADKIKELKVKIKELDIPEPTDQELILTGKIFHRYYLDRASLPQLQDELKKLKEV